MDLHVLQKIALQTNLEDIPNLYQTDKNFSKILSDPAFWKENYARRGVTLIEEQSSAQDYVDDLKNCLLIRKSAKSIVSKLMYKYLLGWTDAVTEENYLEMHITDPKSVNIPGVDLKIVKRMLNDAKKKYFRNSVKFGKLQGVEMCGCGLNTRLVYNRKTERYCLLFSITIEYKILYQSLISLNMFVCVFIS